ncbi:TAF5-like RNA polymerase II p300/CBP-associated factor-associated factor 65 kDa subunit 5L isoform X3 [Mya arenaria]|uniref:TAF5-like RNA polymerase II p300/CBP-associated factor-associated factor 65 kDa subunit 5L isoform X3 n=1 Tax=Mya arenaria TaxID=6604 RepID=UPI0022E3230F|nr:TAF5-like RNA polymerase II p300/CBP-associated factor-associated factor 65 kDa subunit 5L isoform X3 [Mya arenaria]
MKRTKYEHLHSTVTQYLKRRQFSDSETSHKKECRWQQPLAGMALHGSAAGEATGTNSLAFSSITGDPGLCEQQYNRLKAFLSEQSSLFGADVHVILFPVFVHIYIELLSNGHKTQAHKFFARHNTSFKVVEGSQSTLQQLSGLYSKADMISCKEAQAFKDMKYKVTLNKEKFETVHRYLKNDDNMVLLQVLNQHMQLDVKTDEGPVLGLNDDKPETRQQQLISPAVIPDNKVVKDDQALMGLKQVIKEVRERPPGLPSICFYTFLNAHQGMCCASTSHNDGYLSGGFEDSSVKLWRLTPGTFPQIDNSDGPSVIRLAADFPDTDEEDQEEKRSPERECIWLGGHTGSVYQTAFTWDSNFLLTCSDDTTVRLWDLEKQTNAAIYRGHNYPVWDVDTSVVGDHFVSCSHDQTAKLWSTERTYPLRSFVGHSYDVDCVRFHPNTNYIATGSGDKTVRMWSVQDGKSVRLLSGHKSSVLSLAFSPNGMLLASAGEDRRVRVWDLRTGTALKEFRGHTDTIYALAFNQNSSMLASGGLDSCIRIWDLRKNTSTSLASSDNHNSAELLGAFPTKSTPVVYLNFNSHNVLLAAGAN